MLHYSALTPARTAFVLVFLVMLVTLGAARVEYKKHGRLWPDAAFCLAIAAVEVCYLLHLWRQS